MPRDYAYQIQPDSIAVHLYSGKSFLWPRDHPKFEKVKEAIKAGADSSVIVPLMDVCQAIATALYEHGDVSVNQSGVLYKGVAVHDTLTERILQHMSEDIPFEPLVAFMSNLYESPRRGTHTRLFDFLEANKIPFTEDGCFLVYKKVDDNYMDYHQGKYDNSPGNVVEVPAYEVDEDPNQTCSYGLHVCSKAYLPHYYGGSGRVVICKVNPADVIAVPHDYNNAKMRVCKYYVIGELSGEDLAGVFDGSLVVTPGEQYVGVTWDNTRHDNNDDDNEDEDGVEDEDEEDIGDRDSVRDWDGSY